MFGVKRRIKDSVSILEERDVLQQMVALGVGYPYIRSWPFPTKGAISDMSKIYVPIPIPRTLNFEQQLDADNTFWEAQNHIQNGDDGYYFLDLHNGHMIGREQYRIEDIIIDFTAVHDPGGRSALFCRSNHILVRGRGGTCSGCTGFLIVPNTVYFLNLDTDCIPLQEFHMMSFIRLDDDPQKGFVVDYDASQNNRPWVIFPYKENNDIIQSQLDYDDQCWEREHRSFRH